MRKTLTRGKQNKFIYMYVSSIRGRNAERSSNSKNWLELLLKYCLHLKGERECGGQKLWEGDQKKYKGKQG